MANATDSTEEKCTLIVSSNFSYDLFAKYMADHGWSIRIREAHGEQPDRSIEEVWGKDGVPAAVHYMDNQRLWTRYLWIHGTGIIPIMSELAACFGGPTAEELYNRLGEPRSRDELNVDIVQFAIAWADAYDADAMAIFRHYAGHEDPGVRAAVIQGLLFTKWPQGLPILRDLADSDPVPELRAFAGKVFENVAKNQSADPS
jgi:hypothetical protein